jgi:mannose-1-phosphate guanylyltransferase
VSEAVVQEGVSIGAHATVQRSVVVRYSSIGAGCLVKEALVGEGCRVGVGNELAHGISLAPGTALPDGSVVFRDIGDGGESR